MSHVTTRVLLRRFVFVVGGFDISNPINLQEPHFRSLRILAQSSHIDATSLSKDGREHDASANCFKSLRELRYGSNIRGNSADWHLVSQSRI